MAIQKGFPPSYTLSPVVRIAEKDLSFIAPEQSFHRAGLVGFASKGPINSPTIVRTNRQLHVDFGYPHPESGDPYMIYAAEQYLLVANELFIVRVAATDAVDDEAAKTASVDIPVSGSSIVIQSDVAGPYVFDVDSYFQWKLNNVLASNILTVPANDDDITEYDCSDLVDLLNDQLNSDIDGIQFFCDDDDKLGVSTTFAFGPDASLELVSVKNALYGTANGTTAPSFGGVTGLGTGMTSATTTSGSDGYSAGYSVAGTWDFTGLENLQLLVVVDGSSVDAIDNVVQIIDLADLEGASNTTEDIVDEINSQITAGTLPGGFYAVGGGATSGPTIDSVTLDLSTHPLKDSDNISLVTLHQGQDARILVKSESTAFEIFDFDGLTAVGVSPSGVSGDVDIDELAVVVGDSASSALSFTIEADSPGIEGNLTQVVVTNNPRDNTFKLDIYTDGVAVESWGGLRKDDASRFYVSSFLELFSEYIVAVDNTDTLATPLNGTYSLAGGSDGIPTDADDQDDLLIGSSLNYSGMYALSEPEQIDIDLIAVPGHSSTSVVTELLNVCQNYRTDCLAIIDPPFGLTPKQVVQWHNGVHPLNTVRFDSDFGALYWPWVQIRDNYNRIDVWVPPSGSVMAVYAGSDRDAAPWWPPAGLNRGVLPGVTALESKATLEERDLMYGGSNAVNPIVSFANTAGFIVWGQKTLQRNTTALNRVGARRTMFVIEKRLQTACKSLLFDPNDEDFERKFVTIATSILEEVKVGRGIFDFRIDAGAEINTPDVKDRHEFRARIGVQPIPAVEFIFLEFSIHRTGDFGSNAETFN